MATDDDDADDDDDVDDDGVGAAVVAAASFSPPPPETQGQGNRYEHHSRQQRSTRETVKVRTVRKSVPQRELQVVALTRSKRAGIVCSSCCFSLCWLLVTQMRSEGGTTRWRRSCPHGARPRPSARQGPCRLWPSAFFGPNGYSACSTSLINWRASQPCSLRLNWASMGSKGFKLSMGVGAKARDDTSGAMHAQCGGDGKTRRC